MWRVSSQDYRGWRAADLNQPRPPIHARDFDDKRLADLFAREQRAAGMTVSVGPVPHPKRRAKKYQTRLDDGSGKFNANWRLHR